MLPKMVGLEKRYKVGVEWSGGCHIWWLSIEVGMKPLAHYELSVFSKFAQMMKFLK